MGTQAKLGNGIIFDVKVDATWVHIGEIDDIGGPNISSDDVEVTNHDSVNKYKEFISGLKDGGTISVAGNLIKGDAGQLRLLADQNSGVVRDYRVILPDATTEADRSRWGFTAKITSMGFTYPQNAAMKFSGSLKISGEPALYNDEAEFDAGGPPAPAWVDDTYYAVGAEVKVSDTDYVCIVHHISDSNPPPANTTNWEAVA